MRGSVACAAALAAAAIAVCAAPLLSAGDDRCRSWQEREVALRREVAELRRRLGDNQQGLPPAPAAAAGAATAGPSGGACPTVWSDAQGRPWDHGGDFARLAKDFYPWLDKVYDGETRYDMLYSRMLDGVRDRGGVRMLEVGLGCWWRRYTRAELRPGQAKHMRLPPGASMKGLGRKRRLMGSELEILDRPMGFSVEFWRRYLPGVEYWLIEYQDKCLARWNKTIYDEGWHRSGGAAWYSDLMRRRVFWGGQDDPELLARVRRSVGPRGLDVVVDDGSHEVDHQIRTLHGLWPALRPGGVYFIEDLQSSYHADRGGLVQRQQNQTTAVGYLQRLLADLAYSWRPGTRYGPAEGHVQTQIAAEVLSVTCARQICAIAKRAVPYAEAHNGSYSGPWPCALHCGGGSCACSEPPVGSRPRQQN